MLEIRRAIVSDAELLSALCLRSKAYWGYDEDFMERVRGDFAISEDYIKRWPVYVATEDAKPVGFYGFRDHEGEPFLCDLWVEPAYIRGGVGTRLWKHALQTARASGYQHFLIESDPNAEGFYLRMGAQRIGEIRSPSSGRMLPLLKVLVDTRQTAAPKKP